MNPKPRFGVSLTHVLIAGAVAAVPMVLILGVARKMHALAIDVNMAREIFQMTKACEEFKDRFGLYPPDMHDQNQAEQFMQRAFPQCSPKNYPKFENYGPASALPLWLGGLDGRGLSDDPTNPFSTSGNRAELLMEFDRTRLKPGNKGVLQFYPTEDTAGSPYVYFLPDVQNLPSTGTDRRLVGRGSGGEGTVAGGEGSVVAGEGRVSKTPPRPPATPAFRAATSLVSRKKSAPANPKIAKKCDPKPSAAVPSPGYDGHPGYPPAKPYCCSSDGKWINADSFQIISPGRDGKFGSGNHFPAGRDYDYANFDDIANFSNGTTMQRSMP